MNTGGENQYSLPRLYGISLDTESSWEECLSSAHRQFVLEYLEAIQAKEAAIIDQFLETRA